VSLGATNMIEKFGDVRIDVIEVVETLGSDAPQSGTTVRGAQGTSYGGGRIRQGANTGVDVTLAVIQNAAA